MLGGRSSQFQNAFALVVDRRLLLRSPFAGLGLLVFEIAQLLGHRRQGRFVLQLLSFEPLRLGVGRLNFVLHGGQLAFVAGEFLAQSIPIDAGDLRAKLLQPFAVFAVAAGLAGLGTNGL